METPTKLLQKGFTVSENESEVYFGLTQTQSSILYLFCMTKSLGFQKKAPSQL